MLQSLHIKNYILIEQLDWTPVSGFNIVTGETGAGKSIILGAVGLLTGERADTKTLLNDDEKCIIEGVFNLKYYNLKPFFEENELDYEPICTIRREISPGGKSRAFINDTPVNLEAIRDLTGSLLNIHSQHDNLLLGNNDFQLQIVDAFAENSELLKEYHLAYIQLKKLAKKLADLEETAAKSQKEYDYNSFLLQELKEAKLLPDEQEKLESEQKILENAEEIKTKLGICIQGLSEGEISVFSVLNIVNGHLNQLSKISTEFEPYRSRVAAAVEELKDINKEIARIEERTEADPARSMEVSTRLDLIYKLQKKHAVSDVVALLNIQDTLETQVEAFANIDQSIATAKKELENSQSEVAKLASSISTRRKGVFEKIETELKSLVADLGMPNAGFKIECSTIEYSSTGSDKIQMLFSANKGMAPAPLKNAASGGEFSRLMFALKYMMAAKSALPTLIFDEVDTGISGEIALKMGRMMKSMSQDHQIVTITHLHPIAALGDAHYFVYKNDSGTRTLTGIKLLNTEERIAEIAQMIGGKSPSQLAFESAKELLEINS